MYTNNLYHNGDVMKMNNFTEERNNLLKVELNYQNKYLHKQNQSNIKNQKSQEKKIKSKSTINESMKMNHQLNQFHLESMSSEQKQRIIQNSVYLLQQRRMIDDNCLFIWFEYLKKNLQEKSDYLLIDSYFFDLMKRKEESYKQYFNNLCNDLIKKKFALIVLFRNNHFTLYIVSFGNEKYINNNNEQDISSTQTIIALDSLNGMTHIDRNDLNIMNQLISSVKTKKMNENDMEEEFEQCETCEVIYPTLGQPNFIDCGIYVCYYIEELMLKNPSTPKEIIDIIQNANIVYYRDEMSQRMELMLNN